MLAGINEIETAFGTNLNVSSAGAMGWMQFIPSTWEMYGVDANGDGVKDPYNPEDAIFAAASYLSAAGMPADTYGAIYAYNHADWYVAEVLANAACYAARSAAPSAGAFSLTPAAPGAELHARPTTGATRFPTTTSPPSRAPPPATNSASAASGRWPRSPGSSRTSAAGWASGSCRSTGPLGLDRDRVEAPTRSTATKTASIRHADPADSAATLARLIWSRGSLRAGIFTHNQAAVVRAGGPRRGRTGRRAAAQLHYGRLGASPCPKPPPPRRSTGTT